MTRYFLLLSSFALFINVIAQPASDEIKKYHISKVFKNRTMGESAFPETYWYDRKGNDSARMVYDKMNVIKNTFKAGKLVSTVYVDADGKEINKLEYTYNADGSYKVTTTDGDFGMKSYEWYNPKKKIIKSQSPDGNTTTFRYNAKGNLVNVSSDGYNYGIKIKRQYFYNSKNLLTKIEEEMDGVKSITAYTYNSKGQLVKKDEEEDGMKTSTTYTYDGKGKVIKEVLTGDSPLGPSTTTSIYEYNEKGLLVKLTSKRIVEEQEVPEPDEITVYEYEYY